MKTYLRDFVEWLAQRIVIRATTRAIELVEGVEGLEDAAPRQLPAPRMPEIEHH